MLINEVCKRCSLTKKAIEYYEAHGLITPLVCENGYRNFSDAEVERLSKIAVLRRLGLSVSNIRSALAGPFCPGLRNIAEGQKLELDNMQAKQALIQELAAEGNWEGIRSRLDILEKKQSILRRLLEAFPGYYGRYAAFHFAQFLNEPIETAEQEQAFNAVIGFLDDVHIEIPEELYPYFEEVTAAFSNDHFQGIRSNLASAINDPRQFISEHQEDIEQYLVFKESEEYKLSPAYQFKEIMQKLYKQNGYYDVFLPAMCRLSPSYKAYHEQLLKADDEFRNRYSLP